MAKKYFAIQALKSPKFDKIFVQLGNYKIKLVTIFDFLCHRCSNIIYWVTGWFHIELSYYKAIRKFISESGMPYILVESGHLAAESLSGFLEGKNYNQCKRIHDLAAVSLQTLHFRDPTFLRFCQKFEL